MRRRGLPPSFLNSKNLGYSTPGFCTIPLGQRLLPGVTTTTGITFGSGASIGASFALNTSGFQNTLNGTFGLAQVGNDLNITYTTSAVPEPSTFGILFGLAALGFTATRRRRV